VFVTDPQLATRVLARRLPRVSLLSKRMKGEPPPIGACLYAEDQILFSKKGQAGHIQSAAGNPVVVLHV